MTYFDQAGKQDWKMLANSNAAERDTNPCMWQPNDWAAQARVEPPVRHQPPFGMQSSSSSGTQQPPRLQPHQVVGQPAVPTQHPQHSHPFPHEKRFSQVLPSPQQHVEALQQQQRWHMQHEVHMQQSLHRDPQHHGLVQHQLPPRHRMESAQPAGQPSSHPQQQPQTPQHGHTAAPLQHLPQQSPSTKSQDEVARLLVALLSNVKAQAPVTATEAPTSGLDVAHEQEWPTQVEKAWKRREVATADTCSTVSDHCSWQPAPTSWFPPPGLEPAHEQEGPPQVEKAWRRRDAATAETCCTISDHCAWQRSTTNFSSGDRSDSEPLAVTFMIRNIPPECTQDMLVQEWPMDGGWDMLYLPWNSRERRNYGYVFINFTSNAEAAAFKTKWQKMPLSTFPDQGRLSISLADIQGFEANVAQLKKKRVDRIRIRQIAPIILRGGHRVELSEV